MMSKIFDMFYCLISKIIIINNWSLYYDAIFLNSEYSKICVLISSEFLGLKECDKKVNLVIEKINPL